jgi:hypothetical protein
MSAPLSTPDLVRGGYYTLPVLANGVDFCLLDPSGSMAFKDHVKGCFSSWYKRGRPHAADPLGLVKLTYSFFSDKGKVEAHAFSQDLDVREGRLLTRLRFHQMDLDLEVFLTDDHTLVERFHVRSCSAKKGVLRLDQAFPRVTYTFKPFRSLGGIPGAVRVASEAGRALFRYRYDGEGGAFEGLGITGVRLPKGGGRLGRIELYPQRIEPGSAFVVSGLRSGAVVERLTTVIDDMDTPAWRREAGEVHARHMARPFGATRAAHAAGWRESSARASFECSSAPVTRGFEVSLAACRMGLHPNGSVVPELSFPSNHGMATFWDAWFTHAAFLRLNHVSEARRMVDFWRTVRPLARRLARARGVGGARYPWSLRVDGKPWAHDPRDDDQIHNNVVPAINAWEQWLYTGDRASLAAALPMIEDCVRFVLEDALRRGPKGKWFLRELQPVDESNKKKRDELTTAAIALRGIRIAREAALVVGAAPAGDLLAREAAVEQVLRRLWVRGAWHAHEGAGGGSWATALAHLHLPGAKGFRRSIDGALAGSREPFGLGCGNGSRMRCATFPWVEAQFAWSMALNGDGRGFALLERMMRFANVFGGLSEYLWLHGEPSRDWYVSAHGAYLCALADLCVQRRGNRLAVFPTGFRGVPWPSGAFRGFRAAGGVLVDAEWNRRGKLRVEVTNDSTEPRRFDLGPGGRRAVPMDLSPGQTARWSGGPGPT